MQNVLTTASIEKENPLIFETLLTECVYDDIHGFVALTQDEKNLINHPYFRRLHFIKQNALANFIFPGATHTRFSHSVGVLFIVEKMIQKLKTLPKWKINITPFDHQIIRLAALLHDIGHYPLSHTIEECFKQYDEFFLDKEKKEHISIDSAPQTENNPEQLARSLFIEKVSSTNATVKDFLYDFVSKTKYDSPFHHEKIAKVLVSNIDSPLYKILKTILTKVYYEYKKETLDDTLADDYLHLIGQLICGNPRYATNKVLLNSKKESDKYFILSLLLHSDLDADQMDYMLRDTRNTGIQTTIRVDFLINNMDICYQKQRDGYIQPVLCFNYKAFESVQQFIFSKAYWYTEIILYDKVALLNRIAQRLYLYTLILDYNITSLDDFYKKILFNQNEFIKFTDQDFWNRTQQLHENSNTPPIIKKMVKILIGEINIPKALSIDETPETKNNKIYTTSFVPKEKSGEEKLEIYQDINRTKSQNLFPIFYSNKFFKKSTGESSDRYANRSIYILTSPCKTLEICGKNCEKVEDLLKSKKIGSNLIHKIMYKQGDFTEEPSNYEQAYIEKCVIYNFDGFN